MGIIAITGSQGFVGKHVSKYFYDLGYEVKLITRSEFLNQEWSVLKGVETVIHCAWPTDKDLHSIEHLEFAEWTCNFFKECKDRGIRVINIGSSSEYGVKDKAMKEDMICEPVNVYGIAKLSVTLYAKLLGFNTLRLFSPYGEGGKNFLSIYEKVEKYGNPKDTRDYQPIEMVCHAIERLLHAKHLYGEIINVCSGTSIKNIEAVFGYVYREDLRKNYDGEKWFKYRQNQYEPQTWIGDTTKMKKLLNL